MDLAWFLLIHCRVVVVRMTSLGVWRWMVLLLVQLWRLVLLWLTYHVERWMRGRELLFFLRALILQDGDAKGDAGKKEDGDNLPLILAILRTIKGCENVVDKTKTEVRIDFCRL